MGGLQGQRSADEINMRVAATVDNVDEALTWIVRQLERHDLDNPQGGFSPITSYDGETNESYCYFEVWIAGTSKDRR